jgi:hypothetical protein
MQLMSLFHWQKLAAKCYAGAGGNNSCEEEKDASADLVNENCVFHTRIASFTLERIIWTSTVIGSAQEIINRASPGLLHRSSAIQFDLVEKTPAVGFCIHWREPLQTGFKCSLSSARARYGPGRAEWRGIGTGLRPKRRARAMLCACSHLRVIIVKFSRLSNPRLCGSVCPGITNCAFSRAMRPCQPPVWGWQRARYVLAARAPNPLVRPGELRGH